MKRYFKHVYKKVSQQLYKLNPLPALQTDAVPVGADGDLAHEVGAHRALQVGEETLLDGLDRLDLGRLAAIG